MKRTICGDTTPTYDCPDNLNYEAEYNRMCEKYSKQAIEMEKLKADSAAIALKNATLEAKLEIVYLIFGGK